MYIKRGHCIALFVLAAFIIPQQVFAAVTLSSTKVGSAVSLHSSFTGPSWICSDKSPRVASRIRLITYTLINDGKTQTNTPVRIDLTDARLISLTVNGKQIATSLHEQTGYQNAEEMKRELLEYDLTPPITLTTADTVVSSFDNLKLIAPGLVSAQVSFETDKNKDWGCVQDRTVKFLLSETGSAPPIAPAFKGTPTFAPATQTPSASPVFETLPPADQNVVFTKTQEQRSRPGFVDRIRDFFKSFFGFFNPIKNE